VKVAFLTPPLTVIVLDAAVAGLVRAAVLRAAAAAIAISVPPRCGRTASHPGSFDSRELLEERRVMVGMGLLLAVCYVSVGGFVSVGS
jgi:hypothetical protein